MYLIVMRKCCGTLFRYVFIPLISIIFASFLFACFFFFFFLTAAVHFYQNVMGPCFYPRYLPTHYGKRWSSEETAKNSPRCNIVEYYMLCPFSHLFACFWELMRNVWSMSNVCDSNSSIYLFNDRQGLFPLHKRSLPFLTVDATISNRASSYDRCNKFPELS